jgi:hypothetical protein
MRTTTSRSGKLRYITSFDASPKTAMIQLKERSKMILALPAGAFAPPALVRLGVLYFGIEMFRCNHPVRSESERARDAAGP